ncbi:threonine synthase-like 2 [Mya arenaria]|uniref:threonine synthase-like 2 n=1 Tax=Mya arenaria TaxID=6604 RepID=UPI0022E31FDF|nr:threonine synthase-like 2 [Mya arenaria]XP_052772938.1 threonine synthase-like 2 [Mya arenaria]
MKYCSTRGGVSDATFEEAVFTGYAADGGILLPQEIQPVSMETLKAWSKLSFVELAKEIMQLFISNDEIPTADLKDLVDRAFATFSTPEVAPVTRLKDDVTILELFHGRTWAFKDVALSCVGQFINYFCSKSKKHYTIIVGTSGDTGSAAIEAVRGLPWVDIVVLLPRGRTSLVQERQMTSVLDDNVHVFRVDGTSDDLDLVIKPVFMDGEFRARHLLTSINSINWARILVQIVHYFYAYFQMSPDCDKTVEIVVPTGACGNVTSGCIASKMGLPARLVCAVTCNDIVARAVSRGDYSVSAGVTPTLAPAMDIQIPYNMERIWHVFSGGDWKLVRSLMDQFELTGAVQVPADLRDKISAVICETYVVSDATVTATMRRLWEDGHYLPCPHTATAVAYHLHKWDSGNRDPRICIATASVAKFREAVEAAQLPVAADGRVDELLKRPTRYRDLEKDEDWDRAIRDAVEDINRRRASGNC